MVLMDGSLNAPEKYERGNHHKGDEKVPLISAGSIIAKVSRQSYAQYAQKYPSIALTSIKATAQKTF